MQTPIQELQEQFLTNPFLKYIGFEMITIEQENIVVKLSIQKKHHNTGQNLHGGVHAAMLDTVQSFILRSVYEVPVASLNVNVNYLAPSNSGDLFATAKIIQKGYKTATVESQITDDHDQIIAKGVGVYRILNRKKSL
jgi:uncharacterized protein (TIGR00369 family)